MKPSQIILLTGVAIVGILSYTWFRTAARAGEFTTLVPVFDGTCVDIAGMPGAEDMAIDRTNGRIFVSSDDRRATAQAKPVPGAIYSVPVDGLANPPPLKDLTGGQPAAFHPHGTSLFRAVDGKVTLMVVNHPKGAMDYSGTTVEVFDAQADGSLKLRRTVAVPGLTRINDIVATGANSFYATSESDLERGSLSESLSLITGDDRTGAIWYFDGSAGKKLDSGLGFANSLALSNDGKTLYASATMSRSIFLYDRDPTSGAIKRRDAALVGTGIDNLDVDPEGILWMAAHPKMLSFIQHAGNAAKPSPSQILILEPSPAGKGGKIDQVYLRDGTDGFSGASVAIRSGTNMVLGSVFEKSVRVCQLPKVWRQSESHPAQRLLDTERDELKKEAEKASKAGATEPAK
ncbi:MAG: SMP-30/gluconolactonase/LRE family protein [Hyphomonadaceae bacterium]